MDTQEAMDRIRHEIFPGLVHQKYQLDLANIAAQAVCLPIIFKPDDVDEGELSTILGLPIVWCNRTGLVLE